MKLKLLPVLVLAFAGMACAQGPLSNLSISVGGEGVFPAATFTKSQTEQSGFSGYTQATTKSLGAGGELRYDFGHHSAIGASVMFNRSSFLSEDIEGQALTRVKSNNLEFIGNYIFRLPSNEHIKPYALIGGGVVHFGPLSGAHEYTTGNPPQSQSKIAFAYGFGTDVPMSDHLSLRLQYRGLVRSDPDFKLYNAQPGGFGTSQKTHVPEPGIQLVYHF